MEVKHYISCNVLPDGGEQSVSRPSYDGKEYPEPYWIGMNTHRRSCLKRLGLLMSCSTKDDDDDDPDIC
jgi:hypothetical protein